MSDKVKWGGSRIRGAPWPEPMVEHYVAARVDVNGSTHLGRMVDGDVCVQVCNTARNPILLPVPGKPPVECEECLNIMRRKNIAVNTAVRFEAMR